MEGVGDGLGGGGGMGCVCVMGVLWGEEEEAVNTVCGG